jgi:hypothetical protein
VGLSCIDVSEANPYTAVEDGVAVDYAVLIYSPVAAIWYLVITAFPTGIQTTLEKLFPQR